jgi:hypothetical protein
LWNENRTVSVEVMFGSSPDAKNVKETTGRIVPEHKFAIIYLTKK